MCVERKHLLLLVERYIYIKFNLTKAIKCGIMLKGNILPFKEVSIFGIF